jgi:hypothetical protein
MFMIVLKGTFAEKTVRLADNKSLAEPQNETFSARKSLTFDDNLRNSLI